MLIAKHWGDIKAKAAEIWGAVRRVIGEAWDGITTKVDAAVARLNAILDTVRQKTEAVKGFFKGLYEAVVGHSYVPDMVDEVGAEMQRLHENMSNPARTATQQTLEAFRELRVRGGTIVGELVDLGASLWGSFSQGAASALAQAAQGMADWAAFGQQMLNTMLTAVINFVIQQGAQWVLATLFQSGENTKQAVAHDALEGAKTASTIAGETARTALVVASNKIALGAMIATIVGIGAVGNAALAVAAVIVNTMVGILTAMSVALLTNPYTAEAGAEIGFTAIELGIAGNAAIGVGAGALQIALGTAITAATATLATPFAEGGIVTGPTLALIGEAGPEAVVPLGSAFGAAAFAGAGGAEQTIIVQMDGREVSRRVVRDQPKLLRLKLGTAFG